MTKFSRPFTPRPRTGITSLLLFSLLLFNDRARVLDFMQDACNMRQVFFFFSFSSSSLSLSPSLSLSLFPRKPRYIALRITLNIAFNIRSCFPVSLFACFDREKKKGNFVVTKLIAREYHTLYFNFVKTRSHDARSIEKLSVSTPSVFLFPFFFFSKLRSKRSIRS